MPDLGSMGIGGPAYIAIKSHADSWLETGETLGSATAILPHAADANPENAATNDPIGPPPGAFYGNTREIKAKVEREYGGIGSHGGPVVSGRSDHSDFFVEQSANKTTSTIYQHCCNGQILDWVHLVLLSQSLDLSTTTAVAAPTKTLHIRLQAANVSSFEFVGGRYFGDRFSSFTGDPISGSSDLVRGGKLLGVTHVVRYTLWYTSMSIWYGGVERGWNTGADTVWRNT